MVLQLPRGTGLSPRAHCHRAVGTGRRVFLNLEDAFLNHEESLFREVRRAGVGPGGGTAAPASRVESTA